MACGKVKWFNNAKGFGFIVEDGCENDIFAHYSTIVMDGYKTLKAGQDVTFDEVVLVGGENTVVGTPLVSGATVVGTVEKQGKQKKVVTYKYKPKKGSHRKQGHRQPYTKVVINAINA